MFTFSYGFDVPEGVLCDEGKAYNPYFPNGSVLAMPQQLFDDGIEYKDGTPATMSQQAKDVVTVRFSAKFLLKKLF
jgi:ubiquinol-cytochrome c reductase cytochrome c1 subunit